MIDITVQELKIKIDNKDQFHLIDVREPSEFEEYILDAKLIPLSTIPHELENLQSIKNEEIVIHCRSGARSYNAQQYLLSHGFKNVRNLIGGILAWQEYFDN